MVITRVTPADIVLSVATSLGLDYTLARADDNAFLAAVIRRAAGGLCPCSPTTLVASATESLQDILPGMSLKERLTDVIESLTVMGDLLELCQVTIDNSDVKGTWVFIGPPSFVARPNGSIVVTGISPDEPTALPIALSARIHYEGVARILYPIESEDLPSMLRDLGLVELSFAQWLHAPPRIAAQTFWDQISKRLTARPQSGSIPDLNILLPSTPVTQYRNRWIKPTNQTGSFVARRPQAYGAPLWGLVHLLDGAPVRFLDFPLKEYPFRGCDVAWHLQMAIDANRGAAQKYRRRATPEGPCLDVFSPLPLWADRRLRILGKLGTPKDCLVSYLLPEQPLATEECFLQEHLWLTRLNND